MRVAIFFGGPSKEREVSFAGGRTVYDNLDKSLFEAVPIFVDSHGRFILLEWQYLYKGTIRDFYPPASATLSSPFQVYIESLNIGNEETWQHLIEQVGTQVWPHQFQSLFDIAFLALHGPGGEDGTIQGLLAWYQIPYTGTGILGSAIGIDKAVQKSFMQKAGFEVLPSYTLSKDLWKTAPNKASLWETAIQRVGLPLVVKSAHQGSSIGIGIVKDHSFQAFEMAIHRGFFMEEVTASQWKERSTPAKQRWITSLVDIREGIGMPVRVGNTYIYHPNDLFSTLETHFSTNDTPLLLENVPGESKVVCEPYIEGREFSCIVIAPPGRRPIALAPTEMILSQTHFDYRAKYLPGIARKQTPMTLEAERLQRLRETCVALFEALHFQVYARIDGFLTPQDTIYLNDPNTTSGMNPSSFLFHQAAAVGLNPSQFITFLIRTSLAQRLAEGTASLETSIKLHSLDKSVLHARHTPPQKMRIGVLMGGFSAERHVSVESGRNIYEKLATSTQYQPIPLYLSGTSTQHRIFTLPLHLLLKDNADDIHEALLHPSGEEDTLLAPIRAEAQPITDLYGIGVTQPQELAYQELRQYIDFMFIAIHGRPGEDGEIQARMETAGIPYNGSGVQAARLAMDKFETNQLLHQHGILVAPQYLVKRAGWEQKREETITRLENKLGYPMIAKPADEGCSAGVIKIRDRVALECYAEAMFRNTPVLTQAQVARLGLLSHTEFPCKDNFLVETFVDKGNASHFLEITGGMLTHAKPNGKVEYEIFEPSESVAVGEILSLEEKFLAGAGQNITPSRFHTDPTINLQISAQVKQTLAQVAQIVGIEGYARIDAFVKIYPEGRAETWIIEINTLPAMTPATCIFHQCALNGYTPLDFIDAIIQYGIHKAGQPIKTRCYKNEDPQSGII